MAERAAVTAVILIIVLCICLYMTESFIPIGKNLDFRDVCREYLMKMEYGSGLSETSCVKLESDLEELGFADVVVSAPSSAKAGSVMSLEVDATFKMDSIAGIFRRVSRSYRMSYDRKAVARKVINR